MVVVDDVCRDVVDRFNGRLGPRGEDAADDRDRVADSGPNVEAEDDGNSGLNIGQNGVGDVRATKAEGVDTPPR